VQRNGVCVLISVRDKLHGQDAGYVQFTLEGEMDMPGRKRPASSKSKPSPKMGPQRKTKTRTQLEHIAADDVKRKTGFPVTALEQIEANRRRERIGKDINAIARISQKRTAQEISGPAACGWIRREDRDMTRGQAVFFAWETTTGRIVWTDNEAVDVPSGEIVKRDGKPFTNRIGHIIDGRKAPAG